MPTRYFESRSPQTKLYCRDGRCVVWESYDGVVGWHATDSPAALFALDKAIETKTGGLIRELTKDEYEAELKKVAGRPRWNPQREHLSADGLRANPAVVPNSPVEDVVVAAADDPAAPDESPSLRRRGAGRRSKVEG